MSFDPLLAESCPPHVRWVYCRTCDEYVELAGVVCHGDHIGQAACAEVQRCPRCEDGGVPLSDDELESLRFISTPPVTITTPGPLEGRTVESLKPRS